MGHVRVWGPLLVGAALVFAWWWPGGDEAVDSRQPVDLLVELVRLPDGRPATLAIDDGRVVGVGYTREFGYDFSPRQIIDANGAFLIGGVHDHHAHLLSGGKSLDELPLGEADSLEVLGEAVQSWAEAHPDDPWIIGRGWSYSLFPGGLPASGLLDQWVSDRPVMLEAFDGHAQWANRAALERAGVTRDTPDPPEGTIVRDDTGEPTGVFLETAQALIEAAPPSLSEARRRSILFRATQHLLSRGVTTVDDMVYRDPAERVALLRKMHEAGELPIRIRVFPVVASDVSDAELDAIERLKLSLSGHPRISLPGIKLFLDGVIESKTAYLKQPYATGGGSGAPRLSGERLGEILEAATRRGLAVVMHAIGDAAVAMALDRVEGLEGEKPPLLRLEHIELIQPEDRPRLAALGVEASMQPLHADPGGPDPEAGAWSENLGPGRLPLTFPWRSLLDAGATLRFGSDWPVVTADPLPGVAVALTRQNRDGEPAGGWVAEERIDLTEALQAYDAWPLLEPGAPVNLVLLDLSVRLDDPRTLWQGPQRPAEAVDWVLLGNEVHRF